MNTNSRSINPWIYGHQPKGAPTPAPSTNSMITMNYINTIVITLLQMSFVTLTNISIWCFMFFASTLSDLPSLSLWLTGWILNSLIHCFYFIDWTSFSHSTSTLPVLWSLWPTASCHYRFSSFPYFFSHYLFTYLHSLLLTYQFKLCQLNELSDHAHCYQLLFLLV